ncbi:MAG: RnfABCDGE type electron transport complex subunit D [Alphaproteobacteria bacterium]|nr:RnfABCDGE type electron transport complex subunit D [Alphaproteobacteria bacterium]
MLKPVDGLLNHITMYRLVLYYVGALLAGDFALGLFGLAQHDPAQLCFSVALIAAASWSVNRALALAFRVPANAESVWITAGIIALIMPPVAAGDVKGMLGLALASAAGIASKFLFAIYRKHLFNPVALGVVVSAYALDAPATWWVGGTVWLLPIVVAGGLLILRKVQRFEMFAVYALAYLAMTVLTATPDMYGDMLSQTFLSSPMLFAGFAMLTEPMTAPAAKWPSLGFGALVGALSSPAAHIGDFYFTSEVALLLGNVFAWAVNPKYRFKLTLERIEKTAAGCYDYVFRTNRPVSFKPGQYLDWTLHSRRSDDRGNRRTFTIASSPAEKHVRLGVKFYPNPSAYKQSLLNLKPGDVVYGAQLAGEFTLPEGDDKLAFIAGGIGITPFRSMIQHMLDMGERRDVTLFYGNNKPHEIAYVDVFNRAEDELGLRTVYAIADHAHTETNFYKGFIDADLIMREMPDYAERLFYISGPRSMVVKFEKVLAELGIAKHRIKTDFFPGFA